MAEKERKEPFFILQFCYEKSVLKLVPYPILNNRRECGPRLNLKSIWPAIHDGLLPNEAPITFLYSTVGSIGNLECSLDDILQLRDEAAKISSFQDICEFRLNAFMLLGTTHDERLRIPDSARGKLAEIKRDRHRIIPVQFFAIEVEVPKELSKDAKALQSVGLL